MRALEFLQRIDNEAVRPVYLVCPFKSERKKVPSFEPLLAQRVVEQLTERLVTPETRDLAFASFHADESDIHEIIETAETYPFLAERRVVVIHEAQNFETGPAAAPLIRYIESPAETAVMILVTNPLDRRSKFYKACEKSALIIECAELRPQEVDQWIQQEAAQEGKGIEPAAVKELASRAGARLSDVENAIRLVCNYVGENERIRVEDVTAACADVAEEEVWAMTDAIAASDTAKALRCLRQLMELGKNEMELMGTINWLLKTAYHVAAAPSERRVPSFQAEKVQPLVRKLGMRKLRDAFRLCIEAELMLRSTGVDRALALELLVVKLAAPRRQPQKA